MTIVNDWVSPPGETLADILSERHISIRELSSSIGLPQDNVVEILAGTAAITPLIAKLLASAAGGTAQFWRQREAQYRKDLEKSQTYSKAWLANQIPIREIIRLGWLDRFRGYDDEISACLRFFGVSTPSEWNTKYGSVAEQLAYRRSQTFELKPGAVAAWFRAAELATTEEPVTSWDRDSFLESLSEVKSLIRIKDPAKFLPVLKQICASSGVAIAVLQAPLGCPASGATYFSSSGRAMMLLSGRHLSDDHFWFSFFHESAHLVLHEEDGMFLEIPGLGNEDLEREANQFAADILVPPSLKSELFSLKANKYDIVRFARSCGVSPGVIVGQLQYHGKLRHNQLNRLKRRYTRGFSNS